MCRFDLTNDLRVNDATVLEICRAMPNLQHLNLKGCRLSDKSLKYIKRLNLLRTLKISGRMTDLSLLHEDGPCLRYLKDLFISAPALDDAAFEWIPLIGPNLRSLCILNCGFTTNGFCFVVGTRNYLRLR
eukprot:TRINITY_DN1870_c0_g1_i1.p1 TRINITY_DN1870_c0_g1~~TRINITY_DN1870_c0_g1_i1.p1  ORF type:complete len:130 (-),score=9.74 TRINITY_DN1870_c0_g1_i1:26-415(-)